MSEAKKRSNYRMKYANNLSAAMARGAEVLGDPPIRSGAAHACLSIDDIDIQPTLAHVIMAPLHLHRVVE